MTSPPRIAISLGASFLGFATHAGFLDRLHQLGVRPTQVAGASAGAIAAGLYAAGLPREVIRRAVFDPGLRHSFIKRTKWGLHHFRNFCMSRSPSLFEASGTVDYLDALLPGRRIEDLTAPQLTIALTDFRGRKAHLAQRGPLARAMAASCCVPGLFSPLEFEGMLCLDGGIAHETPMDSWLTDDAVDLIIVHRVVHGEFKTSPRFPANVFALMAMTHGCATDLLLEYRQSLARALQKKILLVDTAHERPSIFSSRRMPDFYAAGEQRAQSLFDTNLRPLLDDAPAQLLSNRPSHEA